MNESLYAPPGPSVSVSQSVTHCPTHLCVPRPRSLPHGCPDTPRCLQALGEEREVCRLAPGGPALGRVSQTNRLHPSICPSPRPPRPRSAGLRSLRAAPGRSHLAVPGWLCVRLEPGRKIPLHLRDSLHLSGSLTGGDDGQQRLRLHSPWGPLRGAGATGAADADARPPNPALRLLFLLLFLFACRYPRDRVSDHMDLGPSELVGRSCYQFVHGQDATRIRQSHVDCETHLHPPSLPTTPQTRASHSLVPGSPSSGLPTVPPAAPTAPGTPFSIGRAARRLSDASGLLDKGQVMTGYYRWLQRAGGFVWLQSVATVAGSGKSPGEHHVLWVSHVLSQAEGGQTPLDAFQLPASVACEEASSPGPEPTEPEPPTEGKQAAPAENEAPQTQGKRIKVEPGPRETKGSEDSGDEDPSSHPATPRPEFTSVIRAGVLKQDPVRPWGLAPPGDPPPTLLHAGFLPPVVRGLCTPGTIRYGPAELGLVYPHLQRLGPGPALPEAFYPPLGLPYPGPAGTRLPRKGD
ncbi:neuronal PAS domain-containing protein 1 isoform X4 [Homo sapiens]|uniref:neuronal PAS domain-containing protein 1 isoform X4 n=1 Tax=Homo sapiens TaxID=9606 RepID=UPI0007DC7DC1|nr:neuronal PAS domain-containing protein 1 isoform X4 [Homo sapiens]XP_054177087.1 neuronal PAS domain-containing protein 1 isoform X4 [Homo sapiens]|eukprot:XP_016882333.1 neuronal PAS domain-containing protein 1 isoform X1 [Homo sapiens]